MYGSFHSLLHHTVDLFFKAKIPSSILEGRGCKEGKKQNSIYILNEIYFRICIFRNLHELEAEESLYPSLREIFSDNKLVRLFLVCILFVCLFSKFPHVCQAGVKLSVTCHIFQVFLGALSFVYFAKALAEGYLKSTITQIERRFDIPSSLVGVIDGSFEIGRYCRYMALLLSTRSSRRY